MSFPDLLRQNAAQLRGALIAADLRRIAERLEIAATEIECEDDAERIRDFAVVMIAKMQRKTIEGRTGWTRIPPAHLWAMLRESVAKGDPVDVANFAMMIHHNREVPDAHGLKPPEHDTQSWRYRQWLLRPILERLETMSASISEQQDANTAKLTADLTVIKAGVARLQDQLAAIPIKAGEIISQEQEDAFTAAVATADTMAAALAPPAEPAPAEPAA